MGARLISGVDPWVFNQRISTLETRAAMAAAFPASVADRLLVEGGVLPSTDDAMFATTSSGTSSAPAVTIGSGQCVIPVAGNYGYSCTWPSGQGGIALTAPPATNPRKDLLVARVYNAIEHGDSLTGFYLETIDGVAASNPQPPAVPAGAIPLKNIQVATTGALTITDRIYFTRAAGGVRRTENDGGRAGSHPRDLRISTAATLDVWDGGVWKTIASPAMWSQFTPVLCYTGGGGGVVNLGGTGSLATCNYQIIGKRLDFSYYFRWGSGAPFGGTGSVEANLPPGVTSPAGRNQWVGAHLWVNKTNFVGDFTGEALIPKSWSGAGGVRPWFPINLSDNRVAPYTVQGVNPTGPGTGVPGLPNEYPEGGELTVNGFIEIV